jgi:DNA primase catalytic core
MIEDAFKQNLKNIPIVRVAEKLGIVIPRSHKILCFLHDENSPSLSFNRKNNTWKCFGCGKGGDVIKLVQEFCKYSFIDACGWLSKEFNVGSTYSSFDISRIELAKKHYQENLRKNNEKSKTNVDPEVYEWVLENANLSPTGKEYLLKRGLDESTIKYFRLVDIPNPENFFQKAREKWGIERLFNCGIAKMKNSKYVLTWWPNVILIPFINEENKVIYLQGRNIKASSNERKYINLSGVPLELFNGLILSKAKPQSTIYICEGAMDAMMATKYKMQAVGVPGAHAFNEKWASRFSKFKIIVIPDNDAAGEIFWKKISESFYSIGINPQKKLVPDESKDLTEFLSKS